MSIIDNWYCPHCGMNNVGGGFTGTCSGCGKPRPVPGGMAYRTPACDEHLSLNASDECPWCKLHTVEHERTLDAKLLDNVTTHWQRKYAELASRLEASEIELGVCRHAIQEAIHALEAQKTPSLKNLAAALDSDVESQGPASHEEVKGILAGYERAAPTDTAEEGHGTER